MSRDDRGTNEVIILLGIFLVLWILGNAFYTMLRSRASDKPRAKSRPAMCHSPGGSCAPRPDFPEMI